MLKFDVTPGQISFPIRNVLCTVDKLTNRYIEEPSSRPETAIPPHGSAEETATERIPDHICLRA